MGSKLSKKDKDSELSDRKLRDKDCLIQTCEEHGTNNGINCMELSEDGSVLATGADDGTIRLWSTKTAQVECISLLEGHEDYITNLLIEDQYLISASADTTIRKWDMSTGACVLAFLGHEATVNKVVSVGDFLFSVAYDKKARCWDADTGECVRVFSGHKGNVTSLLFIPCEKENLTEAVKFVQHTADELNQVGPVDHTAKIVKSLEQQNKEEDECNMYSNDIIITGSLDGTAKSWSIETGETMQTYRGHTSGITCMAVDANGKMLFTGSSDHTIRSWEILKGQLVKVFSGHQTTVLYLLSHRKLLFSASSDNTARCWVMEFGDCTRIFKEHTHSVSALIESEGLPCGDTYARCFDAKSGQLKRTFKSHAAQINCLRVYDKKLYTGSFDGTIKIWDVSDLKAEKIGGTDDKKKKKNVEDDQDQDENYVREIQERERDNQEQD